MTLPPARDTLPTSPMTPDPAAVLQDALAETRTRVRSPQFHKEYRLFLDRPAAISIVLDEVRYVLGLAPRGAAALLDVGCGYGLFTLAYSLLLPGRVVGIDWAHAKIADGRVLAASLAPQVRPRIVQGDAMRLPFRSSSLDVAVVRESISHIPEVEPLLEEIRRTLRPGGTVFIKDFNNEACLLEKNRLLRLWNEAEWRGTADAAAYVEARLGLLKREFPSESPDRLRWVARRTRGLYGARLRDASAQLFRDGRTDIEPAFHCRCPYTGYALERPFSPARLTSHLRRLGFSVRVLPPRHFRPHESGWKRNLARLLDSCVETLYPLTSPVTSLIQILALKRGT
ncbi:MAG: class I SAM-dependent methyltransferase [Planctomycetes bacterium]|nr:class I SAM-dependent methyltransferase [Planctomycetota bacterium]